jgi:hypothetical protein
MIVMPFIFRHEVDAFHALKSLKLFTEVALTVKYARGYTHRIDGREVVTMGRAEVEVNVMASDSRNRSKRA